MTRLLKILLMIMIFVCVGICLPTCGGGGSSGPAATDDGGDGDDGGGGDGGGDQLPPEFEVNEAVGKAAEASMWLALQGVGLVHTSPNSSILLKSARKAIDDPSASYADVDTTIAGVDGGNATVTGIKVEVEAEHCAIFANLDIDYDSYAEEAEAVIDGVHQLRIIATSYQCMWATNMYIDMVMIGSWAVGGVAVNEVELWAYLVPGEGEDGLDMTIRTALAASAAGDTYYCAVNAAGGVSCSANDQRIYPNLCDPEDFACVTGQEGDDYCQDRIQGVSIIGAHCDLGCCNELWPEFNSCNGNGTGRRECVRSGGSNGFSAVYRGEVQPLAYEMEHIRCSSDGMWYPPCPFNNSDDNGAGDRACPWGSRCVGQQLDTMWNITFGVDDPGYCSCIFNGVELHCADVVDNDDDGRVDCADQDCHWYAENCVEICGNGVDDDFDCLPDCYNKDCFCEDRVEEKPENENCRDGIDNDYDGNFDCADEGCRYDHAGCEGRVEEECHDGVDNDDDGYADEYDSYCREHWLQVEGDFGYNLDECQDGIDNDGDGLADCDDWDCTGFGFCGKDGILQETDCYDGIDNNHDQHIDCRDVNCMEQGICPEICFDASPYDQNPGGSGGIHFTWDNDLDGLKEGFDPDCWSHPYCTGIEPDCANNRDDDLDKKVDCCDPDCADDADCSVFPSGPEVCGDGVDNDCDNLTDCSDPECEGLPGCIEDCANDLDDDGDYVIDCMDVDCAGNEACVCGDGLCRKPEQAFADWGEYAATYCPKDCTVDCGDGICEWYEEKYETYGCPADCPF